MLENFSIANYKSRSILLLVKMSLLTNDLPTDKKKVAEIKKVSYYKILRLLI